LLTLLLAYNLPAAHGDTYTTPKNTMLIVPAPGVLANDTGAEGNTLTAILVKGAFLAQYTLMAMARSTYSSYRLCRDRHLYLQANDGTPTRISQR